MRWVLAGLIATISLTIWSKPANRVVGDAVPFGEINEKFIDESSGIAQGRVTPNTYYTHNDSGDTARFFRFNAQCKLTGTFSLKGAGAIDWEDMASAKIGGKSYLYFGDIGDNAEKRKYITVYRVQEPTGESRELDKFDRYVLTYPDGPHNAETLMVHPTTGDIYIVTKTSKAPSKVFKLKNPSKSSDYEMTLIGEVDVPILMSAGKLITGGVISPDGKFVALRTYLLAYEYPVKGKFDDWMKSSPASIRTIFDDQNESICYTIDGRNLLSSSEGSPCKIQRIPIQYK